MASENEKIKISRLPASATLAGLWTIGVDDSNRSVKISLEFVKTATDAATLAADAANAAAVSAVAAREACEIATGEASAAALAATGATGGAIEAAGDANAAAATARETVERLEELEESLVAAAVMMPTSMVLEYPGKVTMGNMLQKVVARLFPGDYSRNVLFLGDGNAIDVLPDGSIITLKVGVSLVHCVPAINTTIYKTIRVEVVQPGARKVTPSALRLLGNGNFKLI
jgi:hypothetical protein